MSARVRICVQQRVTGAVSGDDMVGLVVIGLGDAREQALCQCGFGRQDIFYSPGSVERFHRQTLFGKGLDVKEGPCQRRSGSQSRAPASVGAVGAASDSTTNPLPYFPFSSFPRKTYISALTA